MDLLCTDKTGTLTQNKLTLGEPFTVSGTTAEQVILEAALASAPRTRTRSTWRCSVA